MDESAQPTQGSWTFLTNHAHVLICLRTDPTLRVRDLAVLVGITERAAHRILVDLIRTGYITKERAGRRNRYRLNLDHPMRHPLERSTPVRELIEALAGSASAARSPLPRGPEPRMLSARPIAVEPGGSPPKSRSARATANRGGPQRKPSGAR